MGDIPGQAGELLLCRASCGITRRSNFPVRNSDTHRCDVQFDFTVRGDGDSAGFRNDTAISRILRDSRARSMARSEFGDEWVLR